MIFDRGGEAHALKTADIAHEIVAGVNSLSAVAERVGIPLADRQWSSSIGACSAQRRGGLSCSGHESKRIAEGPGTLVFLTGKSRCGWFAGSLIRNDRCRETSAATIVGGTLPTQTIAIGTLQDVPEESHPKASAESCLTVMGPVVDSRTPIESPENSTSVPTIHDAAEGDFGAAPEGESRGCKLAAYDYAGRGHLE